MRVATLRHNRIASVHIGFFALPTTFLAAVAASQARRTIRLLTSPAVYRYR